MFSNLVSGTEKWLKKPFDENGSVINWFLFLGLILAIMWLWSRIIVRITG